MQLQQWSNKLSSKEQLSGWTVKTGRHGLYYLHEDSSLSFQTLGAAKVAVQALSQVDQSGMPCTSSEAQVDDNGEEETERVLNLCSCLDGLVVQLQKQMETLQAYQGQPQEAAETSYVVHNNIVDMYDVCPHVCVDKASLTLTQEDTLLQRSTRLRCQLLLATCAVFAQKVLHRSSYTSGYRQHCMYTLLQELKHMGADTPALAMIVEPLLPRAWRKQLEKQRTLKGDDDTDLFAIGIGDKDIAQATEEEGLPVQGDFIVLEDSQMAKLSLKVADISDALYRVPVSKREYVERAIAHAVGQGLDSLIECYQGFETKLPRSKYHQPWLCALKQAISDGEPAEQEQPEEQSMQEPLEHLPRQLTAPV